MSTTLKKSMIAAGLALAAASLCAVPSAFAAAQKQPAKAKTAKAAKAKPAPKADPDGMPAGPDADITDTKSIDYNCELGNKVTIFQNENDTSHIALRWKKRIHRLEKVGTTTGASRFENPTFGLIWIGIPAKGMLLDSKLNRQLANECKNADQEQASLTPPPAKPAPADMPSVKVKEVVEPIVPAGSAPEATAPAGTPATVTPPPATPAAAAPLAAPTPTPAAPQATPSPTPAAPPATPTPAPAPAPADQPQDKPAVPLISAPKS